MNFETFLKDFDTIEVVSNGHQISLSHLMYGIEMAEVMSSTFKDAGLNVEHMKFKKDHKLPNEHLMYCKLCGNHMFIKYLGGMKIELMNHFTIDKRIKQNNSDPCEYSHLSNSLTMSAEINVPTGKLVIRNRFKESRKIEDKLKEERHISIASVGNRQKIMTELASKLNIGYVQTCNSIPLVFSRSNEVIFLDDEDDTILLDNDFEHQGSVICDVWRIEFADESLLVKQDLNKPKYGSNVVVEIEPGRYLINHCEDYFRWEDDNLIKEPDNSIFMRMKRIGDCK